MKEILFTKCLRCGRTLKKKEWREIGFGKTCYEKVLREGERKRLFYLVDGFSKSLYEENELGEIKDE